MIRIYEWFGGRKQFNTYLALMICLAYSYSAAPDFLAFAGVVGGILGLGSFAVAYEDRKKNA